MVDLHAASDRTPPRAVLNLSHEPASQTNLSAGSRATYEFGDHAGLGGRI